MAHIYTTCLLALLSSFAETYINTGDIKNPQRMWDPEKGSILGEDVGLFNYHNISVRNQTAQIGSTAFLHCKVRNMANKKISWIRKRDNHILTSGMSSYSSDQRFSIIRDEGSEDWTLQIKFIQYRDQGKYECQVSTKTGYYGYLVNLNILVPQASVVGASEIHVQSGSTISLLCVIERTITPPQFIFWFHNNQMINYDQSRGGITVDTEDNPEPTSKLTISDAKFNDSGNYTCSASNTEGASVNVYVSEGDKPAAIQRLGSGATSVIYLTPSQIFNAFWLTLPTITLTLLKLLPTTSLVFNSPET